MLIVDDVAALAEQYAYDLRRVGDYETAVAGGGAEALDLLAPLAEREEQREEEHVGRPDARGGVLAGDGERDGDPLEQPGLLLDDHPRRALVDGCDVDPRDDRRDENDPRERLEHLHEPEAEQREGDDLRRVEAALEARQVEQHRDTGGREEEQRQRPSRGERQQEPRHEERRGEEHRSDDEDVPALPDVWQMPREGVPGGQRQEQRRGRRK